MKPGKQIIRRRALEDLSRLDLDPLIKRLYSCRGVKSAGDIDYRLARLPRPELLTGMRPACEILYEALLADASILIVGDYDVDGATSTVLTKQVLEAVGFSHVAYFVPDRMSFGYGLSVDVIEAVQPLQPDLLITVDNGISSHEGVIKAREYGMSVIITDHHLPSDSLPEADAIINPNLPGDTFPGKSLAGVGVAFYLLLGLRSFLRELGWFSEQSLTEPALADWLDLVALGTIADVVPLDYTNRLLVRQGMNRIRAGKCTPGIKALLQCADKEFERTLVSDIGFQVAPRINAAGRLDDMSVGIECLLATDMVCAQRFAGELDEINTRRKAEQKKSGDEANEQIENALEGDSGPQGNSICLYKTDWHPGIVGLIASRLKENYHRPAAVFAADGKKLKGSVRSVKGIHIRDVLSSIASESHGLIEKYGGHAMAAGLTIDRTSFDNFRNAFELQVSAISEGLTGKPRIYSDGELDSDQFQIQTVELINSSGPWGTGFEEPLFDNNFLVISCKTIGSSGEHLRLTLSHPDRTQHSIQAVAFYASHYTNMRQLDMTSIHAAYRPEINRFNGVDSLQLVIEYFDVNLS